MVEGEAMAAEDLDLPFCLVGSSKEDVLKEALLDVVGARTGEEQAVGRHLLHRVAVHLFVGVKRPGKVSPLFDKGGGVEDHQIVIPIGGLEKVKDVGFDEAMSSELVEGEVFFDAGSALAAHRSEEHTSE